MCDIDRVKKEVERFVERGEMFTSVDIANAIKRGNDDDMPEWIKNTEIAHYLRGNALIVALQAGKNYEMTPVPVTLASGAITPSNLYHPFGVDPTEYDKTDQRAITPDEFRVIEASWKGGQPVRPPDSAPSGLAADPPAVSKDSMASTVSVTGVNTDPQYTKFRFPTTP